MSTNQANVWIVIYRFAVPILLATTSYFLMRVIDQVSSQGESIRELELAHAETRGSRFTSMDWAKNKDAIDSRHNILDQRVTRAEANSEAIKESLARIETKLERIQP
jgi:hypothetical protein